jgi:hypothetical protein
LNTVTGGVALPGRVEKHLSAKISIVFGYLNGEMPSQERHPAEKRLGNPVR